MRKKKRRGLFDGIGQAIVEAFVEFGAPPRSSRASDAIAPNGAFWPDDELAAARRKRLERERSIACRRRI